jgi:hypothetical protein
VSINGMASASPIAMVAPSGDQAIARIALNARRLGAVAGRGPASAPASAEADPAAGGTTGTRETETGAAARDASTGAPVRAMKLASAHLVAFSPDGSELAGVSWDALVVWNAATGVRVTP